MGLLRARGLSVSYGDRAVLSGVDFELRPGEFTVFIGANGAGKTTFLKALSGTLPPSEGAVELDGRPLASFSPAERARRIARTEQNARADWSFTVREAASLGRFAHRGWFAPPDAADRSAVDAALERTGLEDYGNRAVTELSGGELQRAMIARALAQEPEILLLDEPVSQLDVKHQLSVIELLRDLAAGGLAVAASVHDLNLAGTYADRIALFSGGVLRAVGSPAEILREELILEAFGIPVLVGEHPERAGAPFVFHRTSSGAKKE